MSASLSEIIDQDYERLERQLLQIAEEMPEDKYSYRPTPDVRTFGEQLRHIAAVQWVVGAGILSERIPVDVGDGDSGPLEMIRKTEILSYARESFSYIHRAIRGVRDADMGKVIPHPYDPEHTKVERLALIADYASHGWEHYGQMVVYQRMNGIVPAPTRVQEL